MKTFFDTSVLVAAFWGDHPQHEASLKVFSTSHKKTAACAAHSLAEVYAVMTRLPVKPLIPPDQAMLFLQDIRDHLSTVVLDGELYYDAVQQAASRGLVGGRIYDALLLACAAKIQAGIIYTWNVGHFQQTAPELADKIKEPS